MADVPDSTLKILTSEVGNDSPATSATMYKIGGAINFLLDKNLTINIQEFTGSGLWVVPADVTRALITLVGGGGGGGGQSGTNRGEGGRAGIIVNEFIVVTPGDVIPITIGAGGSGGSNVNTGQAQDGSDGSPSTFGSLLTAFEGKGGFGVNNTVGPRVNHRKDRGYTQFDYGRGGEGGNSTSGFAESGAAGYCKVVWITE